MNGSGFDYLSNKKSLYGGSGGGGTTNYNELSNRPYFCNVLLQGNIILTQVINSPDDTIIIGLNSIQVNKQLFYTKTQVDSLVAGISATYITAQLPANPSANTYYLVGNDDDGYVLYYYDSNLTEAKVGNYTLDIDEFLKKTDITITINSSSTDLQVPSAKAVYDNFAPISTTKYVGVFKQPNDCIVPFDFHRILNSSNERATIEGLFVSRMRDPVDETSGLFGDLKVRQQCYGGSTAGSATNICIEQTFETNLRGSPTQRKVFFRRGYVVNSPTDIDINNVEAIKNSLTWMNWYPLEYPNITIPTTSLNTSVVTSGNIQYKITGGILIIDFNFLKFATASQNGQIITTNNNFSWISSVIAKINCHCVIHGWKTTVAPTSGFASLAIAGKKITVYDVQADNKEYYGQMIVPLGY